MIIGIDISSLPYGTGVSDCTLNLLRHLVKIKPHHQFKLFFSSLRQPVSEDIEKICLLPHVRLYRFHYPPSLLEFFWHRLRFPPIEFFIGRCDVFHTWDWLLPPTLGTPLVATVHDFVPQLFPQWQHSRTIAVFKRHWRLAPSHISHFICVSAHTQADLLRLYPQIPASRARVVDNGIDQKYFAFQKLSPSLREQKIKHLKKIYNLSNFVLTQGTREPRKNLNRLISAFIRFKTKHPSSTLELAITGKYGWGNDITHPKHSYIKILGYIPEKDMVSLHASATALAYPSLYEGFGLPVAKSMAVGVPVLTSANTSMSDIAANAAVLVNPTSIKSITSGLESILLDYPLRRQLIKNGLKQAINFSWVKIANLTLNLYKTVAGSTKL